jgi:hypothetical protein
MVELDVVLPPKADGASIDERMVAWQTADYRHGEGRIDAWPVCPDLWDTSLGMGIAIRMATQLRYLKRFASCKQSMVDIIIVYLVSQSAYPASSQAAVSCIIPPQA